MMQLAVYLIAAEVLLLLLLRPVILWYLGISHMILILRSIDRSLKLLPAVRVDANRRRTAG
jgi:hypothetical protein